jgi:hypothetical protein
MTYFYKMINELYRETLENELGIAKYLLLTLIVASWQMLKVAKLEILAESLPLPILFESRKKKIKRFLRWENLTIEKEWFPCRKKILGEEGLGKDGLVYIALDRTSLGGINLLMVSLIYARRALPIYGKILLKKGSSGLEEQPQVLEKAFGELSTYKIMVLGGRPERAFSEREFCSVSLGKWLSEKEVYFCLKQKKSTNVKTKDEIYREMRELSLRPGMKLFLNDVEATKEKGFGLFNRAGKWKKTYRGFTTKEPWYILRVNARKKMT